MSRREFGEKKRGARRVQPLKTILIVCEGSKTEKIYFERFKERDSGVKIEVPTNKFTDPVNLVKFARDYAKKHDISVAEGDSIWVVFDVDQNRDEEITKAKALADDLDIIITPSNPSFELWYLLHYEPSTAHLTNEQLGKKLKKCIPHYAKNICVFDEIAPTQKLAIKRAGDLNAHHTGKNLYSRSSNPSTQVFRVVVHIDKIKTENRANARARR
ncbi:hypothetical protein CBW65_05550 [Tumebacillus avium]|uniref:RloB-like protein n=1 Tax=Tumebacillus avium TaxID=1903704 RepID=A0A1Y0IM18_9BACL|nr:RloB family protein [Tumebacillus avium]ARU60605.1 hypothetical protein CBW65_05550 [Tumebacillus avium]